MRQGQPSPELLCKLLRYEPETGHLFWLPRPREMFKSEAQFKRFNTRYEGKQALARTDNEGYKVGTVTYITCKAHRVIWAIVHGEWPDGAIDHINGSKSDNRIKNLRVVSTAINARNAKKRRNNTSGVNGVDWHPRHAKWSARIMVCGKRKWLGGFESIEDAIAARKSAEQGNGFTERHGK